MKKYLLFIVFLTFSLLVGCAYSKSFNFTSKEPQWGFYGEGIGTYVTNSGRDKDQTSLWLSTDWGETQTAFYKWTDLTPGTYKVITYVKAKDVQKGIDGASFWHFHDGGFGTISTFMDLHGDYDWRKIEYTLKVKGSDLTIWFRLKSPGQVWVDEFFLEKTEDSIEKVSIEEPKPLKEIVVNKDLNKKKEVKVKKTLFSFDQQEAGHPFSLKNKSGEFNPQKFYNFNIDKLALKDWSSFDRIELEVFNPNSFYVDFYLTIADDLTTNYWSQLNHKQSLAPGNNKLSFSLNQFVGERGSHRFYRSINLAKIKKFFISIDPDAKITFDQKNFLIDNISLSNNPMPEAPHGVLAFDFTSQKAGASTNFTNVTTQTVFSEKRGYGFVQPKFWRVEDSVYTSQVLRYSIGLLAGSFKVKVPNGDYSISLIVDKLGYWDVPFWSKRMIYINGVPLFKETRSSGKDFLNDLLKFESIVPEKNDHPYDLYLSKIFHSIDRTISVTNGEINFEFEGDATGISLNSLLIWPKALEQQALSYKKALEERNKTEFNWTSKSIQIQDNSKTNHLFSVGMVEPDLYLNPIKPKVISATSLKFQGGRGESPYQVIQITAGSDRDEKISWSINDFTNAQGQKIGKSDFTISDLVYQYTSPDINHETYFLAGKYLKEMTDHSMILKKGQVKYLWLNLPMTDKTPLGIFNGSFNIHRGDEVTKIPVEVVSLSYTLPKVEFPVGFFGLDPLPFSYFEGKDYNQLRKKYRYLALDKLTRAGFTTFTGLPSDPKELDELFELTSKQGIKTVYSYGGQFPQNYLDLSKKPVDATEDSFYSQKSQELKSLLERKNWPKIVHTFSDEAGGYSDKVQSDIELAKTLRKHFPFLALGGFGSFHGENSRKLNSTFDFGFYSSLSKGDLSKIRNLNQRWGFYNASAGNLDDPRFSFGLGLYIARLNGLSQYLEWHSSAFNNYPYYDFDGRESDSVMFFPTSDGKLNHSVRFEFSTEGIAAFRKLKLLEDTIAANPNVGDYKNAKEWLDNLRREHYFFSSTQFLNNKKNNFRIFETQLNDHLKKIFKAK